MSDRPKSTPPPPPESPAPSWEDAPAFREIFLVHFPPEAAEALRQTGRHLYDAVLEVDLTVPDEPWVRARVLALAADLRVTAEVFASLADAREGAHLSTPEYHLAATCQQWAGEVLAIFLGIAGALGKEVES